ncbi:MAG: tyrosine-type recombinase/integrase [Planctomycetota bacterium]
MPKTSSSAGWSVVSSKTLVKNAGIRYCTFRDLRRSFATAALRAGVDRHVVRDLGGWSDVKVWNDYYAGDLQGVYDDAMKKIIKKEGA